MGKKLNYTKVLILVLIVHALVSLISKLGSLGSRSHTSSDARASNTVSSQESLDQSLRLCEENPYAKSLHMSLSAYGEAMDDWMANRVEIEKHLTIATVGHEHTHKRFEAFQIMGSCDFNCIGGECREDTSKFACGIDTDTQENTLEAPCVVYSIGGDNNWNFEMDVLAKTPCEVHTFDCTGDISRFQVPSNPRLHFHHICLGTQNEMKETGEFWTLDKITETFNHKQIDLFKMDTEGYEFPLLSNWPTRTDKSYESTVLPMQVLVEVHYQTQMPGLSENSKIDWKFTPDMINLHEHLLKMGYAVLARDDSQGCPHCTRLTLVRIRCPEVLPN